MNYSENYSTILVKCNFWINNKCNNRLFCNYKIYRPLFNNYIEHRECRTKGIVTFDWVSYIIYKNSNKLNFKYKE